MHGHEHGAALLVWCNDDAEGRRAVMVGQARQPAVRQAEAACIRRMHGNERLGDVAAEARR